MIKDMLVGELV